MITMVADGGRRGQGEALGAKRTHEELAHDKAVCQEVEQLSRIADRLDEFREALESAKYDYETAKGQKEQEERKLAWRIAANNYDRAMRARADVKRLMDNNPRAFGRHWLRPADLASNRRYEAERAGLLERLAVIESRIKKPFPPV